MAIAVTVATTIMAMKAYRTIFVAVVVLPSSSDCAMVVEDGVGELLFVRFMVNEGMEEEGWLVGIGVVVSGTMWTAVGEMVLETVEVVRELDGVRKAAIGLGDRVNSLSEEDGAGGGIGDTLGCGKRLTAAAADGGEWRDMRVVVGVDNAIVAVTNDPSKRARGVPSNIAARFSAQ